MFLSGVGKEKVESALYPLFQRERKSTVILNLGFAGALDPRLDWGNWVLCDKIYYLSREFSQKVPLNTELIALEEARRYFGDKKVPFQVGSLVTVDRVCAGEAIKEQLFKETEASVVDMEAYHLAKVASRKNVFFLSVKIVSDTVGDSVEEAIKSRGLVLSHRIAEILPDLIIRLVRLGENKCGYTHVQ